MSRSKNPESYLAVALKTPLFYQVPEQTVTAQLSREGVFVCHFEKGETICSRDGFERCLGFLTYGRASVLKDGGEASMLMSVLHAGELFGAASLFGAGKIYVATIRALESTWAVMISESAVKAMMRENTQIAENYMSYLTARIRFLSARIDGFAQGNVEDRVLLYIQRCAVNGIYTPEYSISALSDALCISRTTLYRSLDKLERSGHLVKDGKIIRLCKGKEEII